MEEELAWLDAHDVAHLIAQRQVSAREVVEASLARIERLDPIVHALVDTDAQAALDRASLAREGPFAGVPWLWKDSVSYPGLRWTLGSRAFAGRTAEAGSPFSDRIDVAGFVTVGKAALSELGLLASTEALLGAPTRNPHDLERSALGSSGGSAVAVACGMVPVAHASDGGGSIRLPASAAGVFGFKPSARASLPTGSELGALADLVSDHVVSRSVRDSARVFGLTQSPLSPWPEIDPRGRPERASFRVGAYSVDPHGQPPVPEVATAFEATKRLCSDLGHEVIEVAPPPIEPEDVLLVFFAAAGEVLEQVIGILEVVHGRPVGHRELEPYTWSVREWYRSQGSGVEERAEEARRRVVDAMERFLQQVDVVLSPTLPILPPLLGALSPERTFNELRPLASQIACYTSPYNVVGAPAMSVPLYSTPTGVPIGSQFGAAPGEDGRLWALAHQLEVAAPWAHRRPALACLEAG